MKSMFECLLVLVLHFLLMRGSSCQQLVKVKGKIDIMWSISSQVDQIIGYSVRYKQDVDTDWTYIAINDPLTSYVTTPYLGVGDYQIEYATINKNGTSQYESLVKDQKENTYPTTKPDAFNTMFFYESKKQPASYSVLLKDDFSSGQLGTTYPGFSAKSVFANDQPEISGQSLRINLTPGNPLSCSGSHWFGGRKKLPAEVPYGNRIWYSVRLFHPANQTWGYIFGGKDDYANATSCGQNSDGNVWLKHLVLAPKVYTIGRLYVSPVVSRRNTVQKVGLCVIHEFGPLLIDTNAKFPIDKWFTLQIEVLISLNGYFRLWINDNVVAFKEGPTSSFGNPMAEWGIGDYWNGVPYTDGAPNRDHFWIKDVIIATDASGYGLGPTDLDVNGNRFISPLRKPTDFV